MKSEELYDEPIAEVLEIVKEEKPDLLEPLKEGDRFQW
ncbi:MAG: hypothetical protein K0S07_490 [Chlamydiales bacterium]|jgi:hypothetical protein|nr:hypothetical protein [Chlamydiales bacterium]